MDIYKQCESHAISLKLHGKRYLSLWSADSNLKPKWPVWDGVNS